MANKIRIETTGMHGMQNDFDRLSGPAPYEYAHEQLNDAARDIFDATQKAVPVGKGDKRRPAGALRDSGRLRTDSTGTDVWNAEIAYGTEDDTLPYAIWARWKHHHKTGVDYMAPTEDLDGLIAKAMNSAWDEVFPGDA